ncbi:MAG: hypothetical protein ACI9HK_002895 [Pirellulaceae bacterium]|jgi:hypothetical protein
MTRSHTASKRIEREQIDPSSCRITDRITDRFTDRFTGHQLIERLNILSSIKAPEIYQSR